MNTRALFRCFLLFALLLLIGGGRMALAQGGPANAFPKAVAGEILVGFRPAVQDAKIAEDIDSVGAIADFQPKLGVFRLKLRPGLPMNQAIQSLALRPEVAFAEPNYICSISSTPDDTSYANQYAIPLTQTDKAWDIWSPSSTVVIAIVDTGVQTNHPDLANKIFKDANGVIVGYNSILNNTSYQDDNSHGTHCAGIAAAQVNNGAGIAGVAGWTGMGSDTTYIKIMPVKCMGANGSGSMSDVATGVVWAVDHGANVISMSLGGTSSSTALSNATDYAWSHGCLVVAAAGNSSINAPHYPAANTNVLSVASTDNTDTLSSFSNYGSWVKIAAPGSNIYSTLPGSAYGYKSGTSMATPFVAGAAALIWAHAPNLTNQELNDLLIASVDPYNPYSGRTIATGAGRINVYQALQSAAAPTDPVLSRITINPASIYGGDTATGTVLLTAPAPTGGAVVTLSSADMNAASVPTTVTVDEGLRTATFTITGGNVTSVKKVSITATFNNLSKVAPITVSPLLASLAVAPSTVKGGVTSKGTVTINAAAPNGGRVISLSSSDSAATVPSTVTVAAGAKTATFNITTTAVSADATATITATFAGVSKTANLTVQAPALVSLVLNPTIVADGASSTGTVTLDAVAPTNGITVNLASDNSAATVSSTVSVAAGSKTATFTVSTSAVTASTTATISATLGSVKKTATLTIQPLLLSFTVAPGTVKGGIGAKGTVTLNVAAPNGGKAISLSSSDSAVTVPSSVMVAAGAKTATFNITTTAVATDTTATITASYANVSKTAKLIVQAPTLVSVALNPAIVADGASSTGTVTLDAIAPANGITVNLASDNNAATVSSTVSVAAGSKTATFTVSTSAVTVNTTATITATLGSISKTAKLTIQPMLLSLTVAPSAVKGGIGAKGMITLNAAAPANGITVSLSSSDSAATVPSSVTIASGARTATFNITTTAVAANVTATITASYAHVNKTATLTVQAPALVSVTLNPAIVADGASSTGTVTLDAIAPANGTTVALSSSNSAATVPTSVSVAAGAKTATFTVSTSAVTANTTAIITGSLSGVNRTATLTIQPMLLSLTLAPSAVKGGVGAKGIITLNAVAPTNGITVALSSNNSAATVPSTVTVTGGARTATFNITTTAVSANAIATITASYANVNKTANLTVQAPALVSLTLNPAIVADGAPCTATVTLDGIAPTGGADVILTNNANSVSWTITVPAGAKTASAVSTTPVVTANTTVILKATYNGISRTATLTLQPLLLSLTVAPSAVKGGIVAKGTIILNAAAPAAGTTIALSSSSNAAGVPSTVTVTGGARTATFNITTTAVSANATATITASYANVSKTANLTVQAPALVSVTLSPATVKGGASSTGTVTLDSAAPTGGLSITLASNSSSATVSTTVMVQAGAKTATFSISTSTVMQTKSAILTATLGSVSRTATLTLTP